VHEGDKKYVKISLVLPEGHIHWEYEGIDERIILKWFLRKYG
jgi:hypothetical protein